MVTIVTDSSFSYSNPVTDRIRDFGSKKGAGGGKGPPDRGGGHWHGVRQGNDTGECPSLRSVGNPMSIHTLR